MIEERNWYGEDWKNLRDSLMKLCLQKSDDLLTNICTGINCFEKSVKDYFTVIANEINNKIPQDKIGLWKKALPLIVNQQRFAEWLWKDQKALKGHKMNKGNPISPRQALGRKLWQHFELARREQLAAGRGVSVNRIKTWERLERISREVARKAETGRRCTEAHFAELAGLIKKKYSHDKNLPRKINTVRDYFYQFSDDCLKNMEHIDSVFGKIDTISINDAKGLLHGVGKRELEKCLKRLSPDDFEVIDVAFKLGLGKVQYLSVCDFLRARFLNEEQYEEKRKKVMEQLKNCLEFNLEKQFEENRP